MVSSAKRAVIGEPTGGAKRAAYRVAHTVFGMRTLQLMWFDMLRLQARMRRLGRHDLEPSFTQLHLGCGSRRVAGWLNVDVSGSDYDIDFTKHLPWQTGSFSAIVSEHVIEHFELFGELLPLLTELNRVLRPDGEIWLSCPDMEKICSLYLDGRTRELVEDRLSRDKYSTQGAPPQQIVNDLFHQWGEHKNLFDFEILRWALERADFTYVRKVDEAKLLERFPGFPARHDDNQTLYVSAQASPAPHPHAQGVM
jgi:predicted SAM-dependent methyltransferase